MSRIAIFVDSGYLFAQGSAAISGSKKPRISLSIEAHLAIEELRKVAEDIAPGKELLRVYWYDGSLHGAKPTTSQAVLAASDNVKLRLGFINSHGQQKGVDSLIVTDLIELARLQSITDALLLSGDEDVRVGVQIAQNYGVRVHLLGIHPARGSQSQQLRHEADTTREWSAKTVSSFLALNEAAAVRVGPSETELAGEPMSEPARTKESQAALIERAVAEFVDGLDDTTLDGVLEYWKESRGVPPDLDRRLLPACRDSIGRNLEPGETKMMRVTFRRCVCEKCRTGYEDAR